MKDTKLAAYEMMMMCIPNFEQKKDGNKMINEKDEYKKCKYCISYRKDKCTQATCPYLMERAMFGQVHYKQIVSAGFKQYKNPHLKKRISHVIQTFHGDLFVSSSHKARFEKLCKSQGIPIGERTAKYGAIIYLLTVDNVLWTMGKDGVRLNSIDFKAMDIVDIHTDGYALYQIAKKINEEKEYTRLEEFGDKSLITDNTFKAIINAILIAKHGVEFMNLNK